MWFRRDRRPRWVNASDRTPGLVRMRKRVIISEGGEISRDRRSQRGRQGRPLAELTLRRRSRVNVLRLGDGLRRIPGIVTVAWSHLVTARDQSPSRLETEFSVPAVPSVTSGLSRSAVSTCETWNANSDDATEYEPTIRFAAVRLGIHAEPIGDGCDLNLEPRRARIGWYDVRSARTLEPLVSERDSAQCHGRNSRE